MKSQAVTKPKRVCLLLSTVVNTRRLINNQSFHNVVLAQDPPPGAPLTITVKEAQRLSGLSRATISRLLKAGQAESAAA
jgi:hypothetical protein